MKRIFSAGMAALIASSGLTTAVSAAETEDEQNSGGTEETASEETEDSGESEDLIESLTMEEAVDYALDDKSSLILLNYRIDNIDSQLEGTEDEYSDLQDDLEDLEDQMDELRDVQDETGKRTFQTRLELQNQIESLEDNLETMEDSIRELESNDIQLRYDRKQAHRSAELSAKSTFIQLLTQKDQMETTKASLENQKQQAANTKRQVEIGTAPASEYQSAQREVQRTEDSLYEARAQYEHDLAMFALDIGIVYHEDLTLEEPELGELSPLQQKTDTKTLIEQSFSMQNAQETLELAEYNREQVYNDEDADRFDEEQADINVETEEENIVQLRQDLTTSISNTFQDAETQYQAVLQAQNEVSYAREDVEDLRIQAEIGVIPQAEYELAGLQVDQAEQELAAARSNLFMINEQIKAMRDGLVQQSGGSSAGQQAAAQQ
ncbi:TolC family protein [Salibacterium sp. K-3]